MAFLPEIDEDEEDAQQPGDQGPIPSMAGTGGPSSPGAGSGGPTPGATPTAPWQNIGTYLAANAPQAQNTANTLAGNLNTQYQGIQDQAAQAKTSFLDQVNQGAVSGNEDLFNRAKASPSDFVKNQSDVDEFQRIFNAQYGGPNTFGETDDYSKLQGKIGEGKSKAALAGQGESGINTLLRDTTKNMTPGMASLDTLLLQQDPESFKTIKTAADQFNGLDDFLSGTQSELDAAAMAAKTGTEGARKGIQDSFLGEGGVVPTFQTGLQDRFAGTQKKYADQIGALNNLTPGTALSQESLDLLGISPESWNNISKYAQISGDDPRSYLTSINPGVDVSRANFSSADDYATEAALEQLTGQTFGTLDPNDLAKAGTAPGKPFTFDTGAEQGQYKAAVGKMASTWPEFSGSDADYINQALTSDRNDQGRMKQIFDSISDVYQQRSKNGGSPATLVQLLNSIPENIKNSFLAMPVRSGNETVSLQDAVHGRLGRVTDTRPTVPPGTPPPVMPRINPSPDDAAAPTGNRMRLS